MSCYTHKMAIVSWRLTLWRHFALSILYDMWTGGQESDIGDSSADGQAEVSSGQVLLQGSCGRVHDELHRRSVWPTPALEQFANYRTRGVLVVQRFHVAFSNSLYKCKIAWLTHGYTSINQSINQDFNSRWQTATRQGTYCKIKIKSTMIHYNNNLNLIM